LSGEDLEDLKADLKAFSKYNNNVSLSAVERFFFTFYVLNSHCAQTDIYFFNKIFIVENQLKHIIANNFTTESGTQFNDIQLSYQLFGQN
jgi:hypothetical protein